MEQPIITEQIQAELDLWKDCSHRYYNFTDGSDGINETPLSDVEFDKLTKKLISYGIDSITAVVTKTIQTTDGLVDARELKTEMVSLYKVDWETKYKTLSLRDIQRFFKFGQVTQLNDLWCALKFDGHALKLVFKDNVLVQALSRGGQDWTKYFLGTSALENCIKLLKQYDYETTNNIYHCELVLSKQKFNETYSTKYKNARNAVSGVLKTNPNHLTIIPLTNGISPLTRLKIWSKLSDFMNRFGVSDFSLESVYKFHKEESYPYRIDGLVLGYESETQVIKDNYPLNMVSVKFEAVNAVTEVIGLEWSQKKTGSLNPVYLIKPILIDGSEVSRAAGYNYASVMELKAGIGAIVEVEKSNDIIPKITRVIKKSKDIPLPTVEYRLEGREAYAVDDQISKEHKFVLALKLLKIEGIGDKIAYSIGEVVMFDIINAFDPMFKPAILQLLGDSANWRKFKQIYDIKSMPLDQIIQLLQFNGVGPKLANKFALAYVGKKPSMDGVDRNVALYVLRGDGKEIIQRAFERFKELSIKILAPLEVNDATITYEMSNSPTNMSKEEFSKQFKRKFPNSQHTTLTKNTKLLIVDSMDAATSKMNRARKYNVQIITYKEALESYVPSETEEPETKQPLKI